MALTVRSIPLPPDEYVPVAVKKNRIVLHHTAGSHRPDWVVHGWTADRSTKTGKKIRVATAYVIGGLSTTSDEKSWDGVVVNCFPDEMWAWHLGATGANSETLESQSVGIEICNYGPLTKTPAGVFFNYVSKPVPAAMSVDLGGPFKQFQFYHRYTPKQLAATKELLLDIAARHSIDLRKGLPALLRKGDPKAFDIQQDALDGKPGLWTHVNTRRDKFDCHPQPELIEMLKSL